MILTKNKKFYYKKTTFALNFLNKDFLGLDLYCFKPSLLMCYTIDGKAIFYLNHKIGKDNNLKSKSFSKALKLSLESI